MVSDPLVTSGHCLASGCWRLLPVASSPYCVWCWTENLCPIALITTGYCCLQGFSCKMPTCLQTTRQAAVKLKKTLCPTVAKGTTFSLKTDKLKFQFATSNSASNQSNHKAVFLVQNSRGKRSHLATAISGCQGVGDLCDCRSIDYSAQLNIGS